MSISLLLIPESRLCHGISMQVHFRIVIRHYPSLAA